MKLSKTSTKNKPGFTLIELLVVIAIIGILSSVVLASLSGARENARETAAQSDLQSIQTAIHMMLNDTGVWPGGCNPSKVTNAAASLDSMPAGLTEKPVAGTETSQGTPCEWSAGEVANWSGPYMDVNELNDPWGNSYRFDTGWLDKEGCGRGSMAAIFSYGSDGSNYTCDDIYVELSGER